MPIFEYVCKNCGHQFELLVFPSDRNRPTCPVCNHTAIEKLMSAASVRLNGIPSGSGGFKPPACAPAGKG